MKSKNPKAKTMKGEKLPASKIGKKSKVVVPKKIKDDEQEDLHVQSFDQFLETLSNEDEESDNEVDDGEISQLGSEDFEVDEGSVSGSENGELSFEEEGPQEQEESNEIEEEELSLKGHKKALKNLEQSDPEFFSYLKENDAELLNFDDDEDDDDLSSEDDDEEEAHKPPESLEVASDSEVEEETLEEEGSAEHKKKLNGYLKKGIVNLYVISDWEKKLTTTKDPVVLGHVIDAFECAVQSILNEENQAGLKWKIEGSGNFNALVRLCIRHVKGFCVRFLYGSNNEQLAEKRFDEKPYAVMEKSKGKWVRLRSKIKKYMKSLVIFLKSMGNPEALTAVLRHCQKMSGFWALMASKSFKFLKTLIGIWSAGEDSCRVAAFVVILRIANYNKEVYLTRIFKQMYMTYVANCKFTSVNTWGAINFMRASLIEVYLLDTSLAYNIAFPFIRQLAIHLRNAITAGTAEQPKQGKSEASRIVYSWQFVHSIHVWSDLLAQAIEKGDEHLKLLVYPTVQICLGTIRLIPTKKYIPLRFHIIKMLINLQQKSRTFIPILPLVTEVLNLTDFGGKTVAKFSVRPLDLTCCLKVDPSESGYYKAVSETIFECLLGTCQAIATELAFPEIVCPTLIQLKAFLKKSCKNAEVSKKYKTLVEKIEAHCIFIRTKREKALENGLVSLNDPKSHQILQVELQTSTPEPPILAYANSYFKVNATVKAKAAKKNIETREERLIPRNMKNKKSFDNEEEDDHNDEEIDFGVPLFSKEDNDDEFKTKFDAEDEEIVKTKKSKKLKRKSQADSEEIDSDSEKPTRQVKKKKKGKKGKKVTQTSTQDIDDELVDLEFSD